MPGLDQPDDFLARFGDPAVNVIVDQAEPPAVPVFVLVLPAVPRKVHATGYRTRSRFPGSCRSRRRRLRRRRQREVHPPAGRSAAGRADIIR
ncbi:hypothetical protein GCM10022419_082980 [Nonomuraea rosea]|uniref:Uncharacterized protein n=1 Tax=Nonomuraea rosea TaxID=638574 RepID=A0ABP6YV60_9ACTN